MSSFEDEIKRLVQESQAAAQEEACQGNDAAEPIATLAREQLQRGCDASAGAFEFDEEQTQDKGATSWIMSLDWIGAGPTRALSVVIDPEFRYVRCTLVAGSQVFAQEDIMFDDFWADTLEPWMRRLADHKEWTGRS